VFKHLAPTQLLLCNNPCNNISYQQILFKINYNNEQEWRSKKGFAIILFILIVAAKVRELEKDDKEVKQLANGKWACKVQYIYNILSTVLIIVGMPMETSVWYTWQT
jgi:hypothetical protein